jgi:parallel beta-helix repeat protein
MIRHHLARLALALTAIGFFAGTSVVVASGVAQAASGTLYVSTTGTDTGTCTTASAPCATIDYALTQAPVNATIDVAAGTYTQQVVITQNTTIVGAAGGATVIDPISVPASDTNADGGQPVYAIVDVQPHTHFIMKKVVIDGAGAQSQFTDCSEDFTGVYYHDAVGQLKTDTVKNIELPPADFGCQDGLGVYVASDPGSTSSVTMNGLTVSAYDKNGITCRDTGTSCGVSNSTVTGIGPTSLIAQNGIEAYHTESAVLQGNTVSDNVYTGGGAGNEATGLLLWDVGSLTATNNTLTLNDNDGYVFSDGATPASQSYFIENNTVSNATDKVPGGQAGYGDGFQIDSSSAPITLSGNTITKAAENGISLLGASNVTVSDNSTSKDVGNGIYVGGPGSSNTGGSSGNTISDNTAKKNGQSGILADTDSSANTFSGNNAVSNTQYNLADLGTGNTWSGNTCTPPGDSTPAGLC